MDAEEYRAESRKGWGSVAEGWEKHAPQHRQAFMPVTAWMLDQAELQPGQRVLELATGTAEVGLMAHELIQPGGSLILSDFAPEMLDAAQRHAAARGADDIRFKQIDIESIDLEAGSQDVVLCRWGLMFLPDPEAGMREIRRVLRPGGRFVTAAWTAAAENPWSSVVAPVLVELGLAEAPDPQAPGQFALGTEGMLLDLLHGAGFVDDVLVEPLAFELTETFDAWWDRTLGMSRTGELIRGLSDDQRAEVVAALLERLAPYEDDDEVLHLPARTWVASASA